MLAFFVNYTKMTLAQSYRSNGISIAIIQNNVMVKNIKKHLQKRMDMVDGLNGSTTKPLTHFPIYSKLRLLLNIGEIDTLHSTHLPVLQPHFNAMRMSR